MSEKRANKSQSSKLRLRAALMALQILLPFGLYIALQSGASLAGAILAGAFVLSMGVMVWLG